jgi:hypothetical protein
MAWVVPALIVAGISAAAAGLAHDIQGFVAGKTPWDNPKEWTTGALKAGALGFAGGFAGGALGPALGSAFGTAGGTTGGTVGGTTGGTVGGTTGGTVGGTTGGGLGEVAGQISSNVGTIAAEAGAPTSLDAATVLPQATADVLAGGVQQTQGTLANALANVGQAATNVAGRAVTGAATGALGDLQHPMRGALTGAAGAVAASGLQSIGQSAGILPSARPEANFQPMGNTGGYSPDSASIMPPRAGYAAPPPGSTPFSTLAANRLGQYGVKAGTMGTRYAVNNALTPTPPQQQPGTYQSFGIRPYFETGPYV